MEWHLYADACTVKRNNRGAVDHVAAGLIERSGRRLPVASATFLASSTEITLHIRAHIVNVTDRSLLVEAGYA